jgi:hypothetical protein
VKNIAILDNNGELIPNPSSGEKSRPDAVLVSPFDLHTYIVPLPPLRADQIAGAVRYRLRALHPGNPDSARVDHQPNGDAGTSVIAFVTEPSIVERYRKTGVSAIAPLSFIRRLGSKDEGRWIGLFCTDRWIEATLFRGAELVSIEAIFAGSYETEKIRLLVKTVAGEYPLAETAIKVLVIPGLSPEADSIDNILRSMGATTIQVLDAGALPSRRILADGTLFLDAPKRRLGKGRLIALFLCLDSMLAIAAIHRIANLREQELKNVKTLYSSTKEQLVKQETAMRELDELESRYAAYTASRPIDMYAIIAEVSRCIGDGAWIKDLVIRGASFAIEAEGTDALAVLTRFSESPRFRSVTLHQAEPSSEKRESFSISGTINDDR